MAGITIPWSVSSFDDRAICQDDRQIDNPVLHRTVSDCVCSASKFNQLFHGALPRVLMSQAEMGNNTCNSSQPYHRYVPVCHISRRNSLVGKGHTYSWTRIHGQEEPTLLDLLVEIYPVDSGLDNDVHTTKYQLNTF